MAGRSTDDLADEELETVEGDPDADFEPDVDALDDDLDPADELDDDLDDDLPDETAEDLDPELVEGTPVDDPDLDDEDDVAILPTFDEDEEELVRAVVEDDDDDTDLDADGLREGEFVCRSCYMAKRESALADPKRMLCRDCA